MKKYTEEQCKDTGMAMVLLLLLMFYFFKSELFIFGAIALHILNMSIPGVYRPVAVVWLGLTHFLGTIVSKLILSIVYFTVVTPVGLWRRVFTEDTLRLKAFKADRKSVMHERNYTFTGKDIERPY
jgi:hypothetical protein